MMMIQVKKTDDYKISEKYHLGGVVSARKILWNDGGARETEYFKDGKPKSIYDKVVRTDNSTTEKWTILNEDGQVTHTNEVTGEYRIAKRMDSEGTQEDHYLKGVNFMQINRHACGEIKEIWNYDSQHKAHGAQFFFDEDGALEQEGWYCHDKGFGIDTEEAGPGPDGKMFTSAEYMMVNFERTGPYKRFYHDGEIHDQGYFLAGKRLEKSQESLFKMFYENSEMAKMMEYRLNRKTPAPQPVVA